MSCVPVPASRPAAVQPSVSTASPLATEAGRTILEQGGNAVDAAVAAAWALCLSEPGAPGIAEQSTLLLFHPGGAIHALDGHSHAAPARSCSIPSPLATLEHAHRRWGRLSWEEVLAAVSIAGRRLRVTVRDRTGEVATFPGPLERTPIRATFRGLEVVTAPPPGGGLQLLVALKLLERLLPCARRATWEEWSSAAALAVHGAVHACELHPVASEDVTPESMRYLVGDERIGLLARSVRRGMPAPASDGDELHGVTHLGAADREGNIVSLTLHPSRGRRTTSSLVRRIGIIVDRGLSLEEAVAAAVDERGKLR
jgi:gamma-glutamyltranspeptidase